MKVLRQLLNAQGVVVQTQEDDIADTLVATTPNIVAIQDAPLLTDTASNDAGPT